MKIIENLSIPATCRDHCFLGFSRQFYIYKNIYIYKMFVSFVKFRNMLK